MPDPDQPSTLNAPLPVPPSLADAHAQGESAPDKGREPLGQEEGAHAQGESAPDKGGEPLGQEEEAVIEARRLRRLAQAQRTLAQNPKLAEAEEAVIEARRLRRLARAQRASAADPEPAATGDKGEQPLGQEDGAVIEARRLRRLAQTQAQRELAQNPELAEAEKAVIEARRLRRLARAELAPARDPEPAAAGVIELPPPVVDLRIGERPTAERGPRRSAWPWILGGVGVLTLLAAIYWGLIASPRFEVESQFAAQSEQGGAGSANLLQALMLGGGSGGTDANRQLLAFIPSAACFLAVDQRLGLRQRWGADGVDRLSRLMPDASREAALEYWRNRVNIRLDEATGLLVLKTEDFDAAGSLALAEAVMDESERLVNALNRKMAEARSSVISQELLRAKTEAEQALQGLLAFQNTHSLPSATGTAEAATATSLGIEAELLRERTGLADLLAVSGDESDPVLRAKARIALLETEATAARQKVAGKAVAGQPLLNELAAEQMRLQGLLTLRQEIYARLLGASVEAYSQTQHNVLHLAVVVTPSLPDAAAYPRLLYNIATLIVSLLLAAGIGRVLWATIQEHA